MPPVKPCPLDLLLASTNWPSLNQLGPNSALTGSKPSSLLTLNSTTDRKSTRLNSSHSQISYADFCLTKKQLLAKWCCRNAPAEPLPGAFLCLDGFPCLASPVLLNQARLIEVARFRSGPDARRSQAF